MSIELWSKGDKITSEKMNNIVKLLNEVETKVKKATTDVDNINTKVNTTSVTSNEVATKVNELSKKYETKLAEVTNAYNKLKEELYALSAKVNQKNVKTNKTKDE